MNSVVKVNAVILGSLVILGCTVTLTSAICHAIAQCLECPRVDGQYKCTKCQTPLYAYDEQTNTCIGCRTMTGCHLCYNTSRCARCYTLKDGPDPDGGTCSRCSDYCQDCRYAGAGKCDKCMEGFRLTSDNTCEQCIQNCRFCSDSTTCNQCKRGYYKVSATQCAICIENCDSCSDASTCTRCFEGYYMKANNNKECFSCGDNCRRCDSNGKCKVCKSGKISETGTCACAAHCLSCNNSGFGKCDTCQHGYKKTVDKTCVRVADS